MRRLKPSSTILAGKRKMKKKLKLKFSDNVSVPQCSWWSVSNWCCTPRKVGWTQQSWRWQWTRLGHYSIDVAHNFQKSSLKVRSKTKPSRILASKDIDFILNLILCLFVCLIYILKEENRMQLSSSAIMKLPSMPIQCSLLLGSMVPGLHPAIPTCPLYT